MTPQEMFPNCYGTNLTLYKNICLIIILYFKNTDFNVLFKIITIYLIFHKHPIAIQIYVKYFYNKHNRYEGYLRGLGLIENSQ